MHVDCSHGALGGGDSGGGGGEGGGGDGGGGRGGGAVHWQTPMRVQIMKPAVVMSVGLSSRIRLDQMTSPTLPTEPMRVW